MWPGPFDLFLSHTHMYMNWLLLVFLGKINLSRIRKERGKGKEREGAKEKKNETIAIRIRYEAHDDFLGIPSGSDNGIVPSRRTGISPSTIQLRIVPRNLLTSQLLEHAIIEFRSGQMRLTGQQSRRDRSQSD